MHEYCTVMHQSVIYKIHLYWTKKYYSMVKLDFEKKFLGNTEIWKVIQDFLVNHCAFLH